MPRARRSSALSARCSGPQAKSDDASGSALWQERPGIKESSGVSGLRVSEGTAHEHTAADRVVGGLPLSAAQVS